MKDNNKTDKTQPEKRVYSMDGSGTGPGSIRVFEYDVAGATDDEKADIAAQVEGLSREAAVNPDAIAYTTLVGRTADGVRSGVLTILGTEDVIAITSRAIETRGHMRQALIYQMVSYMIMLYDLSVDDAREICDAADREREVSDLKDKMKGVQQED